MIKDYQVIGIMSGTSLDGVDLAYCHLNLEEGKWLYKIMVAETVPYNQTWITRLTELPNQPALAFAKTDVFFGKYIGQLVNQFIKKHRISVNLIASHGHTIFHQPELGFTSQIGSGAAIYAETGIPVVCDFRSVDVMLGGQGAPLVPIGDELLFNQYDACLNLGGFSNISFNQNGQRTAFDICPCNIVMNPIAQQMGMPYDDEGKIAASGKVQQDLLSELNDLDYYKIKQNKSLGAEWVMHSFWPVIKKYTISAEDLMATLNYHAAWQIAQIINKQQLKTVLTSGGGTHNSKLICHIEALIKTPLQIPSALVIGYKEALIFAFLGVLRIRNDINCLQSVTGARHNNIGGALYGQL
jgi:anhydro-N-acetylmuramic acid kinase